mmetsp:Transcript_16205/g.35228  ORF Transcript_16205/g.35228 Transcript_16205/m.35228 type:complete len:216 (+) Transcript_16205:723-1370(+)
MMICPPRDMKWICAFWPQDVVPASLPASDAAWPGQRQACHEATATVPLPLLRHGHRHLHHNRQIIPRPSCSPRHRRCRNRRPCHQPNHRPQQLCAPSCQGTASPVEFSWHRPSPSLPRLNFPRRRRCRCRRHLSSCDLLPTFPDPKIHRRSTDHRRIGRRFRRHRNHLQPRQQSRSVLLPIGPSCRRCRRRRRCSLACRHWHCCLLETFASICST